jgi:hypothetical protein
MTDEEAWAARVDDLLVRSANTACERAERRLQRGDRGAILDAVFECAIADIPLPRWANKAFRQAYIETRVGPPLHSSWDAVFGKPHGKHKKLDAKFKASKFQCLIYAAVLEMRNTRPRKTDVFPAVAKRFERFGISEALCRKYFRQVDRMARLEPARTKEWVDMHTRYELLK